MKASNALPAWFTEHIVCWYSPKRQGATNESMSADPTLKDLSGKGRDMTCFNFAWNENSGITADGNMRFDGKSYARTITPFVLGQDFTVIAKRSFIESRHYCLSSKQKGENTSIFIFDVRYQGDNYQVSSYGNTQNDYTNPLSRDLQWLTPTQVHSEQTISRGSNVDGEGHLFVGRFRTNDSRSFNGILYSYLLFDKTLTDEQINYVITNLID